MNEVLIIKRNDKDKELAKTIELILSFGVLLIEKTELAYLFDFSEADAHSKLLSLQAIDPFIDFYLSFPYIESNHESLELASKIEDEIASENCQEYSITSLENQLEIKDINELTYLYYIHFNGNSLKPSLIEIKELINNDSKYTEDDFFFSIPYIRSLLFINNNDKKLKISFVKIESYDKKVTVALKIEYSNGIVKYGDYAHTPSCVKLV
jgi:hypothetical protein